MHEVIFFILGEATINASEVAPPPPGPCLAPPQPLGFATTTAPAPAAPKGTRLQWQRPDKCDKMIFLN